MISSLPPAGIGVGVTSSATAGSSSGASRAGNTPPAANDSRADSPASTVALVDSWRGQRETVRAGISSLDTAVAAARSVAGALEAFAEGGDVQTTKEQLGAAVSAAVGQGSTLVTGASLRLDLGDGGEVLEVGGVDLRFAPPPAEALGDAGTAASARAGAADAAQVARGAAQTWDVAAQRLQTHERVLAVAGARADLPELDVDGAQLAALQVKQALIESGGAIANADPKAILALFRA